jgi:hypothetical protein
MEQGWMQQESDSAKLRLAPFSSALLAAAERNVCVRLLVALPLCLAHSQVNNVSKSPRVSALPLP